MTDVRIYSWDDVDRQDFLKTLAAACQKTDWQVHAYCLLRKHYHLVLETPNANLVSGMAWLQSTHPIRLNPVSYTHLTLPTNREV